MKWSLLVLVALLLCLAACGEDATEPGGDACACPGDQCRLGVCAVRVEVDPACASAWGEAQVYLGDTSAEASPEGTVSAELPFQSCRGFQARITEQEATEAGVDPQEGEDIPLQVVSEDMRLVFPTGSSTVQCFGSEPLVLVMGCN